MRTLSALSTALLLVALLVLAVTAQDSRGPGGAEWYGASAIRSCSASVEAMNIQDGPPPSAGNPHLTKKVLKLMACYFRELKVFDENAQFSEDYFDAMLRKAFQMDQTSFKNIRVNCPKRVKSVSDIEEKTKMLMNCLFEYRKIELSSEEE